MTNMNLELPVGFRYSGLAAGIKESKALDLAIVVSDENCVAAGVYTKNLVRATSIVWNKQITPSDQVRAVFINSGNANACTGKQGEDDNRKIAIELSSQLNTQPNQILVLATGIIGQHLPMDKIMPAISTAVDGLGSDKANFDLACRAIVTTDSGPKTASRTFELGKSSIRIAGMAKGAGMIGPKMATLLCVIMTDAGVNQQQAQSALQQAVDASFNRISVEGHTSTNDAVLLMSSSNSDASVGQQEFKVFTDELTSLCIELARMVPLDGEGAKHLITIDVFGAVNDNQADAIARTVANSNLVKTAVTGGDPNWGRIVSAIGYSERVELDPQTISLSMNGFLLFQNGSPVSFDAAEVSQSLNSQTETKIEIKIGFGSGQARHWTSDLTIDYVKFNSEYST